MVREERYIFAETDLYDVLIKRTLRATRNTKFNTREEFKILRMKHQYGVKMVCSSA